MWEHCCPAFTVFSQKQYPIAWMKVKDRCALCVHETLLCVLRCAQLLQSCLTLCDPMDCSPPGSSVHGILQARILEWVAMPSSKGIFPTQESNMYPWHLLHCRQVLYPLSYLGHLLNQIYALIIWIQFQNTADHMLSI